MLEKQDTFFFFSFFLGAAYEVAAICFTASWLPSGLW